MGWLGRILLAVGASTLALGVQAQEAKKSYTRFPYDGDLQQILTQQLLEAKSDLELQQLLEKHLGQLKFDPKLLSGIDPNDPKLRAQLENPLIRAQIEKLLGSSKRDGQLDPKQFESIRRLLKSEPKSNGGPPEKGDPKTATHPPANGNKSSPDKTDATPMPPGEPEDADRMAKWTQDLLRRLEDTPLGESLRNSPAWHKTMQDLSNWFTDKESGKFRFNTAGLEALTTRLRTETNWKFSLPELGAMTLPGVSMPSLPSLPRPDIGWRRAGNWSPPMPSRPMGPSSSLPASAATGSMAFAQVLLGAAVLGLLAVVLWRLLARGHWQFGTRRAPSPEALGPWPVDPAHIQSRQEVVLAFEYLSLLQLGPEARSLNHRDIAFGLGEADERRRAAQELARLYEQARYTPSEDPFSAEEISKARQVLRLLVGGAGA
jgi:hypothetical protein